jgi:hypothetical protein
MYSYVELGLIASFPALYVPTNDPLSFLQTLGLSCPDYTRYADSRTVADYTTLNIEDSNIWHGCGDGMEMMMMIMAER